MTYNKRFTENYKENFNAYAGSCYKPGEAFEEDGSFITERFRNEESGFLIGVFLPNNKKKEEIVCKGQLPPDFVLGAPYHISGVVINDKQWGLQVNIKKAVSIEPTTKDEIIAFLGSGMLPGIGKATARLIYEAFGDETMDILENDPGRLIEIKGISQKKVNRLIKIIPEKLRYRDIVGFFASYGITTNTINRLIKEFGSRTKDIVSANPYICYKIRGFGWKRCETFAQQLGIPKNDPNRIYAGLIATLRQSAAQEGNTILPKDLFREKAEALLGIGYSEEMNKAFEKLLKKKKIIETDKGIQLPYLYKAEQKIISCVHHGMQDSPLIPADELERYIRWSQKETGLSLTDEQLASVRLCFNKYLSIVTGNAGTGKSSQCKMIVDICRKAGIDYILVSPTGRAAKNLANIVKEPHGYTLHRALALRVSEASDDDFFDENEVRVNTNSTSQAIQRFNKAQVVIADEASMIDTEMAAILLEAARNKHLLLIGDPQQLPSVGPGAVLQNLIDSPLTNSISLTKIFRQKNGSPIIDAAHAVLQGKSPLSTPGVKYYESDNVHVPENLLKALEPYLKKNNFDYSSSLMCLAPMKKTPYSGTVSLNSMLRAVVNPNYVEPKNPNAPWTPILDEVCMCLRNTPELDIYNGDIGKVTDITEDEDGVTQYIVSFNGPDGDNDIAFTLAEAREILTSAYCYTIHKAQGQGTPVAIVILTSSQYVMLNRNLLYSAITRAEKDLILIGDRKAFAVAAQNEKDTKRITGLQDLVE